MISFDQNELAPPEGFMAVVETLEAAGYEAWGVGGALRDAVDRRLAGRSAIQTPDWDVATDARPEEVMSVFPRTVPLGVEHGTVGVLHNGVLYETTTFRRDMETDGRHAVVQFADSIDEDLARRDFTINAMAWRPSTGEFRDPYDGHSDLVAGLLRAVGEASERFAEDYLRVLRGLRFAGRFDLEIEEDTRVALVDAAGLLEGLSAERVREELMKVLVDATPSTALDLYAEIGVIDSWFHELAPIASDRAAWRRHVGSVDRVRPHRPLLRLARLCLPLAGEMVSDAVDVAGTGDAVSARADRAPAAELLARLKFSNAEQRAVSALVEDYLPFVSPLDSSAQVRAWLSEVGAGWRSLFRLHIAGARNTDAEHAEALVAAAWRTVHAEMLEHPPLSLRDLAVDGDDLAGLGLAPGPVMGLMLEELLEQVLEDPDRNERETLLAEAERLIRLGSLTGPSDEETHA